MSLDRIFTLLNTKRSVGLERNFFMIYLRNTRKTKYGISCTNSYL